MSWLLFQEIHYNPPHPQKFKGLYRFFLYVFLSISTNHLSMDKIYINSSGLIQYKNHVISMRSFRTERWSLAHFFLKISILIQWLFYIKTGRRALSLPERQQICDNYCEITWIAIGCICHGCCLYVFMINTCTSRLGKYLNSLWPSGTIWWQRSGSASAQVIDCCLLAPSHYLNQCWLIISEVLWPESNFRMSAQAIILYNEFENPVVLSKLLPHLPGANDLSG